MNFNIKPAGLGLLAVLAALGLRGAEPSARQLKQFRERIAAAQAAGDEAKVRREAQALIGAMGDAAGQPEGGQPTRIHPEPGPAPTAPQTLAYLTRYWAAMNPSIERALTTVDQPTEQEAGLREIGSLAIADQHIAEAAGGRKASALAEMRRCCDALIAVQRPNGLFPFPDIRKKNAFFGRMLTDLLQKEPEALDHGWIVSDGGSGDLQYDNGNCGVAMATAYRLTGEPKYLQSARRSADWVKAQPVVPNWNYNAFSVWFLARLAIESGDAGLVTEARRRCHLGMLPGQMADGRWGDHHNAKLVYHSILCRGMVELAVANQRFHLEDPELVKALTAALDNAADEILGQGVSVVTVPTEALAEAVVRWRSTPRWSQALEALAHAGILERDRLKGISEVGFYAANYLSYAAAR